MRGLQRQVPEHVVCYTWQSHSVLQHYMPGGSTPTVTVSRASLTEDTRLSSIHGTSHTTSGIMNYMQGEQGLPYFPCYMTLLVPG